MSNPNVVVAARFRPASDSEAGTATVASSRPTADGAHELAVVGASEFTFDAVFTGECSQEDVFSKLVAPLVGDALVGYNCTVLAYGQTGSGKTHTVMGEPTGAQRGLLPRLAAAVFGELAAADGDEGAVPVVRWDVRLSLVEIYMEKLNDLLRTGGSKRGAPKLRIREDADGAIFVQGATELPVTSAAGLVAEVTEGFARRATGAHAMNERSSRSHCVAVVTVRQDDVAAGVARTGKLHLVDLAGSESVRKTGAGGLRLKEAQAINKSLSALGNVIAALTAEGGGDGDGGKKSRRHVPYRDSKLTRLLQDSLGGNAKTCLVVTASPSAYNQEETLSTLRFGERARRLRNRPRVNEERDPREYVERGAAAAAAAPYPCCGAALLLRPLPRHPDGLAAATTTTTTTLYYLLTHPASFSQVQEAVGRRAAHHRKARSARARARGRAGRGGSPGARARRRDPAAPGLGAGVAERRAQSGQVAAGRRGAAALGLCQGAAGRQAAAEPVGDRAVPGAQVGQRGRGGPLRRRRR